MFRVKLTAWTWVDSRKTLTSRLPEFTLTKFYSNACSHFQWTETAAIDVINEASIQRSWLVTADWPIKISPRNAISGVRERSKVFKGWLRNQEYNQNESLKFKFSFLKKKSQCEFRAKILVQNLRTKIDSSRTSEDVQLGRSKPYRIFVKRNQNETLNFVLSFFFWKKISIRIFFSNRLF